LIVLDASDVEFLDSSGLRVIVASGIRLSNAGGRLLIEGMSGAVQRVLEVSGLIEQYRA
jgi:anti-sigma B factor antagonist